MKTKTIKTAFKTYRIFNYINQIQTLPFVDEFSAENLDALYLSKFGKKSISDFVIDNMTNDEVTESNIKQMATILHSMFYSKWNRIYSIMLSDLKLLENYQDVVKEVINDAGQTETDYNSENTSGNLLQNSAFNNDDFVNKENEERKDVGKNLTKGVNKNERVKEVTKTGFKGVAVDDYQNAINYLQNNLIYDIIFKDINSIISIQIYDI